MSLEHPYYWLAYLSDAPGVRDEAVIAIAPETVVRHQLSPSARTLLAAADMYHDHHRTERVVFVAAVTRWLHVEHGVSWTDLDVDFFEALAALDAHAPALLIEASPIARAIVANAAINLHFLVDPDDRCESEIPTEPVRAALVEALERDWAAYARALKASRRSHRAT